MKFARFSLPPELHRLALMGAALFSPVLLALLLTLLVPTDRAGYPHPRMQTVSVTSAQRLEAVFERIHYAWPPTQRVPALALVHLPHDMAALEPDRRKALFLRALLPLVLAENGRLQKERHWLEGVMALGQRSARVEARLRHLAWEYGLGDPAQINAALLAQLYERIDELPAGLVLAQAAIESGWGTSRFSLEANNLFGEWTFDEAQGIVPLRRAEGARHFVRRFARPYDSLRSYMNNLNRADAYAPLRQRRARMRQEGRPLDPVQLAEGLLRYSERGKAYVRAVQALIRSNGLDINEFKVERFKVSSVGAASRRDFQRNNSPLKS